MHALSLVTEETELWRESDGAATCATTTAATRHPRAREAASYRRQSGAAQAPANCRTQRIAMRQSSSLAPSAVDLASA